MGNTSDRATRRAAHEQVSHCHERQLRLLLDHIRDALADMDDGRTDAFEVDELIRHYQRSACKLWSFCG